MTDRELLELAAKAAGIKWEGVLRDGGVFVLNGREWNPLMNDGDALRLAVKLGIGLEFINGLIVITSTNRAHQDARDYGGDLSAATRRAIVRAAAGIGKQMEENT